MPPLLHLARYRDIASALGSKGGEEIIVASAGLASAITTEILGQTGAGAVSARIRTLDSFARQAVNDAGEFPRVPSDAERRLAMRSAIATIDDPMMETRGIGAMLERSYRDIRDSGMTLHEFEARLRDVRIDGRMRLIARAWRTYERLIADAQAVDAADVLARAAEIIESQRDAVAPQIVAGFYDMTGAQMRLVSALGAAGKLSAFFIPAGEGDAYAFASRLVEQINGAPASAGFHDDRLKPVLHTTVAQYQEKDAELRAVCRSIRDLLDAGASPATIGITARSLDPDDVRLLERFSAELGFAVSEQIEVPLVAHRLGRAIANLLRLRERNFPRGDVIDLLRDGFRPQRTVKIDDLDIATRKARISGGRSADLRNPSNDSRIEDYRAVVTELEALPASPVAVVAAALSRFRLTTEIDLAAAAAVDEALSLLSRAKRWNLRIDAESVIDLLEHVSLSRQPTTDNRQPVVWVGDVMKFRGRSFDHLFVIRVQEALFPQRRVDDPLLPDIVRRQVGMREIGDGRDEERLLFQLLFDGAGDSIHFSHAASDRFGKILRPSPLLKWVPSSAASRHLLPASGEKELRGPSPSDSGERVALSEAKGRVRGTDNLQRQLQLLARSGRRSTFDGYLFAADDDPALRARILEKLQTVSPTRLEDFGECPQKFLLKHVLEVQDYDDPDRELQMNRRDKGNLDHRILERFYRSVEEDALLRAQESFPQLDPQLRARVDGIIDALFDEDETRLPPFNRLMREIERKTTKRNLHAFLASDIEELLHGGLRPRQFEYTFGPGRAKYRPVDHADPFVIDAHGVPIRVEGSIDRIDEGRGILRIVDYKSGKAVRHTNLSDKIDRGVRLQIALYAMAVAEFFGVDPASIQGAIKPLVVRGTDPRKLTFSLGATESRLRETLELFIRSMTRGAFPAFPNEGEGDKQFNSCKYCPVNHSCRTRHSQAERRALEPMDDPRTLLESLP